MKQVLIGPAGISLGEVPLPTESAGEVLVEVGYSLISTGTELSAVDSYQGSPLIKSLQQPNQIEKGIEFLKKHGLKQTVRKALGDESDYQPTGYSCSGIVRRAGVNVHDMEPGDIVACAGGGKAFHAEYVAVPRNLVVKIPNGCSLNNAASVAIGSIALHGVRQAETRIGEFVAVIGLGLIGQITSQILRASGCRVIGIDLDEKRVKHAADGGAEWSLFVLKNNIEKEIMRITDGNGADATIIAATSKNNEIILQAMQITRKKGRVVIVGDIGLSLKRSPFYEKEIDVRISCSYGPGRYDNKYEIQGVDYPYSYVRWTENRNMEEYLRMISRGLVKLDKIISKQFPLESAGTAFNALRAENSEKPLGVLLKYGEKKWMSNNPITASIRIGKGVKKANGIGLALVGAGSFAQSIHLNNIIKLPKLFSLRTIVDASGTNARSIAKKYGAAIATTRLEDALDDDEVNAVIICTRHSTHAQISIQALRAKKAVFVEKPAAMTEEQLQDIERVVNETNGKYMVGFNRRFSPAANRIRENVKNHIGPLVILYRVNAGFRSATDWTQGPEGGGRIIGEACHMIDLFQFLVSPAKPVKASCMSAKGVEGVLPSDNSAITIRYSDGSIATLVYTGLGSIDASKEYLEIYADGKVMILDDYKSLINYGNEGKDWISKKNNKGHFEELQSFGNWLLGETEMPINFCDITVTTRICFAAAIGNNWEADALGK